MRLDSRANQEAIIETSELALPRAAARVLAACASSKQLCVELSFRDRLSERIFDCLGGDYRHFSASELRCTAYRTLVVDQLARHFFERAPGALGVGVWPLLGTRGHRLDGARWVDVDSPAVARLRRHLLPERAGWMQLAGCLCNSAWVDAVCGKRNRQMLLVLDESVLPLEGQALIQFLDDVSRRVVAGSELVIAFDARALLRPASSSQLSPALELVLPHSRGGESIARYPRLRFVRKGTYPERLKTSLAGVNAVSHAYGNGTPALAHLRVI